MKRRDRCDAGVRSANVRTVWIRRIAGGIGRSQQGIRGRSELRKPVKLLVRNSVIRPVLLHVSEITIERTVLLSKEDDVIQALQRAANSEGGGHGIGRGAQVDTAARISRTCARPTG